MCYKLNKNLINKKTKELSYLLKHDETYTFDEENYRDVSDLINNHGFTYPILEEIIRLSKKDVFEFNKYATKIRALSGHTFSTK